MKRLISILFILTCLVTLSVAYNNCSRLDPVGGIYTSKGTEVGNPMVARSPKILLNSDLPALDPKRRVLTVGNARQFRDCQAAIDASQPGDEVVIDAGYVCGPILLRDKGPTSNFIVIRTSDLDSLPPQSTRVKAVDAPHLAVIETATGAPAISTEKKAHHYQLIGVEVRAARSLSAMVDALVQFGTGTELSTDELPHDLVLARSWVHGQTLQEIKRGVGLNASAVSIVDSTIEEIHAHVYSQAIAGWNIATGPFKIVNNALSSAGENFFIGGAQVTIPGLIPADVEVRRNHLFKNSDWRNSVTSNTGATGPWVLDSLFVVSNVERIWIDGNTFEGAFAQDLAPDYGTQGFAVRFQPTSEDVMNWVRVRDVIFTNNVVHNANGGLDLRYQDSKFPEAVAERLYFAHNVLYDLGSNQRSAAVGPLGAIRVSGQASSPTVFAHNTIVVANSPDSYLIRALNSVAQFTFLNNLTSEHGHGISDGSLPSGAASLNSLFPGIDFRGNALEGQQANAFGSYAGTNLFPLSLNDIGFAANPAESLSDYRGLSLLPSSPLKRAGTDGSDVGADFSSILKAQTAP